MFAFFLSVFSSCSRTVPGILLRQHPISFGMIYLSACLFDKTMLVDELLHVGSSCIGSLLRLYTVEEWWLKEFSRINKLMYIDSINGIMSITTDNHFFSLFFFLVAVRHLQWKYMGSCTCTIRGVKAEMWNTWIMQS